MHGVASCHGAYVHGSAPPTIPPLPWVSERRGARGRTASTWRTRDGGGESGEWTEGGAAREEGLQRLVAPSNRGQVTVGQWLLSPRLPQLRQEQPPGINMQMTYKIRKHHRALDPSCLALGISVNAQSSRGRMGKVSL